MAEDQTVVHIGLRFLFYYSCMKERVMFEEGNIFLIDFGEKTIV